MVEPPFPMTDLGRERYEALRMFAWADAEHGWPLAHVCEAHGRMLQAVADLVRDEDGHPGWSRLVDLDRAPGAAEEIDCLPFIAAPAGVRLAPALGDAERREAIRRREGFHRGRPAAIVSWVSRFTDGTPGAVTLRERYDPGLGGGVDAACHLEVRIRRSRLLPGVDERALEAAILADDGPIPAGLIGRVAITDTADFEQVRQDFDDFDDLTDSFDDFDDLTGYEGP